MTPSTPRLPVPPPLRLLALGDSYTVGEGLPPGASWPHALARLLAGGCAASAVVLACTGWTAPDLQAALGQASLEAPFDAVTLMIGANDHYTGGSLASFLTRLGDLVERAVALAGSRRERVLVLTIPDWSVTPFAAPRDRTRLASELAGWNAAIVTRCAAAGVLCLDLTRSSRTGQADPRALTADGLHPGGAVHGEWARLAAAVLGEVRA